ncbi:MAG TPA: hypothetical protein GXZ28_10530 [Clostridiales bacterium]|nr:hypothetical protein [Clostridiales bacterium]
MSSENIFFAVICWVTSLIFGAIAFCAFKRKDPMHFWSGTTVSPEEIEDIPAYNRANGLMWTVYSLCILVAGILSLYSMKIGTILLVTVCLPGSVFLVLAYKLIYKKYKRTSDTTKKRDLSRPKTPKGLVIASIIITVIIFIAMGFLFYYGEKDPEVSVYDDRIEIKAMYELNIDFSEIADISLIDKSVSDIGIGRRTNGYGGIGGALKGYFKSDTLGESIVFVQSKASPTIKIERIHPRDLYINFRDSDSTKNLYNELIAKYH